VGWWGGGFFLVWLGGGGGVVGVGVLWCGCGKQQCKS